MTYLKNSLIEILLKKYKYIPDKTQFGFWGSFWGWWDCSRIAICRSHIYIINFADFPIWISQIFLMSLSNVLFYSKLSKYENMCQCVPVGVEGDAPSVTRQLRHRVKPLKKNRVSYKNPSYLNWFWKTSIPNPDPVFESDPNPVSIASQNPTRYMLN